MDLLNFYQCYDYETDSITKEIPSVLFGSTCDEAMWVNPNNTKSHFAKLKGEFPKANVNENEQRKIYQEMKLWYETVASIRMKRIFQVCKASSWNLTRYATAVNKNGDHWVTIDVILPNSPKHTNGRVREIDHLYHKTVQGTPSTSDTLISNISPSSPITRSAAKRNKISSSTNKSSPPEKQHLSTKKSSITTIDMTSDNSSNIQISANKTVTQDNSDDESRTESEKSECSDDIHGIHSSSMWFGMLFGLYHKEQQGMCWENLRCDLKDMNTDHYKQSDGMDQNRICLNHENSVKYNGLTQQDDASSCGLYVILDLITIMNGRDYERREWNQLSLKCLRLSLFDIFMKVSYFTLLIHVYYLFV